MRFWLFEGVPPLRGESYTDPANGAVFNFTPSYIELFSPGSNHFTDASANPGKYKNTYIVIYWIPLSETEWFVATCWLHHFDFFQHLMNDPNTSAGTWRAVQESCPIFNTLLQRASNPTNYGASLLPTADPDSNETVWILGAFFGNVHVTGTDDLFDGFPGEKFEEVIELSGRMVPEIGDGPMGVPNLIRYIGSESSKANFRSMMRAAPDALKQIADFARIFSP
ncbi:hypothetical protein [Streptomyces sp. NBC_00069]|uniref:hypothetical protein n=1 Tax=Streptomyces sp. NBC_00069 TaxID=2975639 RepID=UPI0032499747